MENTFIESIRQIIIRDLESMAIEIDEMNEQVLWVNMPGIINPVGVLAIHICGNLKFFIGTCLGNTGYLRNRANEFSISKISKEEIIKEINDTISTVDNVLMSFPMERLQDEMPNPPDQHKGRTIEFFLIQLCCHLSRHRGQLNYISRIVQNNSTATNG